MFVKVARGAGGGGGRGVAERGALHDAVPEWHDGGVGRARVRAQRVPPVQRRLDQSVGRDADDAVPGERRVGGAAPRHLVPVQRVGARVAVVHQLEVLGRVLRQ